MDLNHGTYAGSVIDNRDPEGLARVLVRVPALRETGNGVWARLATLMAGRDSGTLFLPDVGDEVLVVFVQGDLRTPCVIGTLWSKTAPPPAVADPPASVLQVRGRNGVTLRITDDRDNNSLIVETPGGQRIAMRDNPGRYANRRQQWQLGVFVVDGRESACFIEGGNQRWHGRHQRRPGNGSGGTDALRRCRPV